MKRRAPVHDSARRHALEIVPMKSSIHWLIFISLAALCLLWIGFDAPRAAQANSEYRTCVHLVTSHAIAGSIDACKAERDLMRSLH